MAPVRADGTHVVVGVDANRRRLAAAMAFGILSLTVMLMYATNSLSFATLESISRELNNPISLLIDTSEPEYTPLMGDEEIADEMHEYYYVPDYYAEDGDGDLGYADPNLYNMDAYEQVSGADDIRDDYDEQFYFDDENGDGGEPVDPAELGLLSMSDGLPAANAAAGAGAAVA